MNNEHEDDDEYAYESINMLPNLVFVVVVLVLVLDLGIFSALKPHESYGG
jgi:hypothetical protein